MCAIICVCLCVCECYYRTNIIGYAWGISKAGKLEMKKNSVTPVASKIIGIHEMQITGEHRTKFVNWLKVSTSMPWNM